MRNQCPKCGERFSTLRAPRLQSWVLKPVSAVICRSCGAKLTVLRNTGNVFVFLLAAIVISAARLVLAFFIAEPYIYLALLLVSLLVLTAAIAFTTRRLEYVAQPGAPVHAPPKGVAPLS